MLNYTDLASRIVRDVASKVSAFSHIDPDRVAIAAAARWAGTPRGSLAFCTGLNRESNPLFSVWVKAGTRTVVEVSPWFRRQPVEVLFRGVKSRYLISLHLPRLLLHNPLETIVHELFHIGEDFDGSLRRVRHGREFDRAVRWLMREYLDRAGADMAALAQMRLKGLIEARGTVVARSLPRNFQPFILVPAEGSVSYAEGMAVHYPDYQLSPNFRVRNIKFASPRTPRRISEEDLSLRTFDTQGASTLAQVYSRYLAQDPVQEGRPRPMPPSLPTAWRRTRKRLGGR
jgi:hypothetical protein